MAVIEAKVAVIAAKAAKAAVIAAKAPIIAATAAIIAAQRKEVINITEPSTTNPNWVFVLTTGKLPEFQHTFKQKLIALYLPFEDKMLQAFMLSRNFKQYRAK